LEAIALEHDEVEEVKDLTEPDMERIKRRAGNLLDEFKELVFPVDYDPEKKPGNKRKVIEYKCTSNSFSAITVLYCNNRIW